MDRAYIEELEDDLDDLDDLIDEISSSEDEDARVAHRDEVRVRMAPFYADRGCIFNLFDDRQIYKIFRFDKETIYYITGTLIVVPFIVHYFKLLILFFFKDLIEDRLTQRTSNARRKLIPLHQLLVALQFYATGTFQSTVGNILRISQSSVCRCVHDVSKALAAIATEEIVFPQPLTEVMLKKYFDRLNNILD